MQQTKTTPTIRDNALLEKSGWKKVGKNKYESPNGNGIFNRRVAVTTARFFR